MKVNVLSPESWEERRVKWNEINQELQSSAWLEFNAGPVDNWVLAEVLQEGRTVGFLSGYLVADAPAKVILTIMSDELSLDVLMKDVRRFLRTKCPLGCFVTSKEPLRSVCADVNYNFVIDTDSYADFDEYLSRGVQRRIRSQYRKAVRAGVVARPGTLREFYPCYLDLAKRQDISEPFSMSFFEKLLSIKRGFSTLISYEFNGEVAGCSFLFEGKREAYSYFILTNSWALKADIAKLQFIDSVKRAYDKGAVIVNHGPSAPWDGGWGFKQKFGAVPVPTYTVLFGGSLKERLKFLIRIVAKKVYSRKYQIK